MNEEELCNAAQVAKLKKQLQDAKHDAERYKLELEKIKQDEKHKESLIADLEARVHTMSTQHQKDTENNTNQERKSRI